MASSKRQSSSSTNNPATFNGCYDPLDVDSFINYDQLRCPSPSLSPASRLHSSRPSMSTSTSSSLLPANSVSPPSFSGPSHQYDLHKQQTGLPVGALANTLAVNQASNINLVKSQSGFGMSTDDSFFGTNPNVDDFLDFKATSSHNPSLSVASDIDMDFDATSGETLPAFFFPEKSNAAETGFVNPSAIGGQEDQVVQPEIANIAAPQGNAVGRLYPGIHQQQAAMAKAQQQKQQQHEAQNSQATQSSRPAQHSADPAVDERISRLLQSMRQASVASSHDDGTSSNGNMHQHIARMRKEEEDMDEDERLLASEQGKKLSSKERRQLRNKVSARAFRSRRKEYIGQLEGEVAAKTNEANDLRAENKALMDENTRLSDLTRMLLSSSAFSTFLEDLSANGMRPAPNPTQQAGPSAESSRPTEQIQPNTRKDVDPFAVAQQQGGAQVGMTLLPDNNMDLSTLDLDGSNTWALGNLGTGAWGTNTSQVFAVTELPAGPAVDQIDTVALSGKSSNFVGAHFGSDESKDDLPVVERMPRIEEEDTEDKPSVEAVDVEFDESDPAFALYAHSTVPTPSTPVDVAPKQDEIFQGIAPEKALSRFDLVSSEESANDEPLAVETADKFQSMCNAVEAAFQRIDRLTSHLQ